MTFQFDTLASFLAMDGHGAYVWASYIITAIALTVLVWYPYSKQRELLLNLKRQQRIEQGEQ